ncbi:hypothetical protein [Corynebacterium sp.]|jgi:hypothetical protein|nr:hypothetical protein [Corynebacterium sp.]
MVVQCRRHVAAGEIDIAAGRYVDVELEELDGFMDDLAQEVIDARQQR